MFKFFLVGCLLFITATVSVAQEVVPEDLLNIETYKTNQTKPYQGGSFVHIDLPVSEEKKPTFNPIPLLPTGNYEIKTPFGKTTEAAFVPHTTDFNSIIHILNDTDVMMQQTIQFVNTKGKAHFTRVFDVPDNIQITLINAMRDNRAIDTISLTKNNHKWTVKDNTVLSSGIYSYTLSYLIKGIIQPNKDTKHFRLSLTGPSWELPTERFSAIVLFPSETTVKSHTLLFGSNNVQIDGSFSQQTDKKGIAYHLTRPLPAYADVKIDMILDKNFHPVSFSEQLSRHFNHLLFFLCFGILVIYTFSTYLYLSHHKPSHMPLKQLKYYSYISLRFITGKVSTQFLTALIRYKTVLQQKNKTIRFLLSRPVFIPLFVFINVMRKYFITMGMIIGLTVFQANNTGFSLTLLEIITLIISMLMLNIWLYKVAEKPYMRKNMNMLIKTLFQSDITFGASASSLKALYVRLYPYALITGKEADWTALIKQYKTDISAYPFEVNKK